MIESLIEVIEKAYEPARHRELLTALWEQERFFDTPRQRRAAEIARDVLGGAGLREVAVVPYAADGRTRWQDWTTHMAWDCPAASVRMGEQILADRAACPASVVYWSGPLAETAAGVVDGDAVGGVAAERVAGQFVLTAGRPRDLKERLLGRGAVGVLSDFLGRTRGTNDDTTKWCNTWADGPDGWYFRAGDEQMPGFCLSPRAGRLLRQRMAAEPAVRVAAHCDSRLYEGQGQCVTGVVPGREGGGREVWLFGHACEQGAHDNASGVSTYLEAAVLLNRLIESGALPRPRLGIRVITTEEGLGMLSFATEHPDLLSRAVVGLNVDSVGDASEADRPYYIYYGPLSAPNFGWAAAGIIGGMLAARSGGAYHSACKCEPPCSDDMIADPNCGTPTLWVGNGGNPTGYHSSSDTPDVCTEVSLRNNLVLTAAWAYTMANMDDRIVERSLQNLGVDSLELVQLHCPPTEVYYQPETFAAMDALVKAGKIQHYGVSVEKVEEALKAMEFPGVESVQIIFNMFRQRPAQHFLSEAKRRGVATIIRVPLASGMLTGKLTAASTFAADDHRNFNRHGEAFDVGETFSGVPYDTGLKAVEELKALIPQGATLAQLALRWILMFDGVSTVIPGAKNGKQVEDNSAAAGLPALSEAQMQAVRSVYDRYIRPSVHQRW